MRSDRESIGFLFGAVVRRRGLAFRAILSPYEVTPRQFSVLARLWEEDGLPLTDLAQRLYADPSSLCRTIVLMEKSGLVSRERDPSDRRVFRIMLNEKGKALKLRLLPRVRAHEQQAIRGLTPSELGVLTGALRKMLKNVSGPPGNGPPEPCDEKA
jgi:DNA-binding MarR family transcriptional regulator